LPTTPEARHSYQFALSARLDRQTEASRPLGCGKDRAGLVSEASACSVETVRDMDAFVLEWVAKMTKKTQAEFSDIDAMRLNCDLSALDMPHGSVDSAFCRTYEQRQPDPRLRELRLHLRRDGGH
jgi:hypothetical protein